MSYKKGFVTADKLNVRSAPGTKASVLCQLFQGTSVEISRQVGDWKELDLSCLEGYLSRAFVTLTSATADDDVEMRYGIVEPDELNMRNGPGYQFPVLAVVEQGTVLEIMEKQGDWLRVKTKKLHGFIMKDMLVEIIGGGTIPGSLFLAAVNESLVNLRSGPGFNFPVIAVLPLDRQVYVKRIQYQWAEVETVVQHGFIRKDFVIESSSEGVPVEDPDTIASATVTTNLLSLRTGPGDRFSAIALLNTGTRLKVKDMASDWLRVQVSTSPGFAFGNYIQEGTTPAPVETPGSEDPLKPSANEIIAIQSHFSPEQRVMANTWNKYGGLIKQLSVQLGLSPEVALAVLAVESAGKGFAPDGRMMIRFENHYFYRLWGINNKTIFDRHFRFNDNQSWKGHEFRKTIADSWHSVHTGTQSSEWEAFNLAEQLDRNAALQSISMGSPQIMGANFKTLGYSDVEDMFYEFQSDTRFQIAGLFRFIQGNNLLAHLLAEDYQQFASGYNGSAQAEYYGNKIEKHVNEFRAISPMV